MMELSSRCIPNRLPNLASSTPYRGSLQLKFSLHLKPNTISLNNAGLRYYNSSSIKATASEDTSNGANQYVKEEPYAVDYPSIEETKPEKASNEVNQYGEEESDAVNDSSKEATTPEETSFEVNKYVEQEPDAVNYSSIEATTLEESSNGVNQYVKEETGDAVTVNEGQSDESSWSGGFGLSKDDATADDQFPQYDFLNNLKVELDLQDSLSIALLGVGGITALWLTASVVGAIDHIPLLPKLLELVGLGYTIWFSTRYLVFKRTRDELALKIEEIKQQVLGSKN